MANGILPNCNYILSIVMNEDEKHKGFLTKIIWITESFWFPK